MASKHEVKALIAALHENLAHGSGINGKWEIYPSTNGKRIFATNTYDVINDHGFYVRYVDFRLSIPVKNPGNFVLTFPRADSGDRYWINRIMLRDYLEDTFAYDVKQAQETIALRDYLDSL